MSDLRSSITKGLLAALCSIVAMAAGAVSARQEAQGEHIPAAIQSTIR